MKRLNSTNRTGVTLVELLVTMSACAVLLTLSITLLHRMLHVQKRAIAATDIQRTLWRLETTFRSDVHRAQPAESEPNAHETLLIRLQLKPNQIVEYRSEEAALERVLLTKGELTSRERFAFSQSIQATVSRDQAGLVALAITTKDIPVAGSPIAFLVAATPGRDHLPVGLTLVKEVPHE
ncbi:type II secretion system protein J [Anatilimnocola sp. NA78]|uniref:PulJ/GspJ family protein n=1 Tax=Anatilimnocola sp. NA78 TaxID=3415683 RepID=UPI003CE568AC